jgi:hypothetical protein
MNNEKFIECSKKERELILKVFRNLLKNKSYDLTLTPEDGFDKYDGILEYDGRVILIEVKIREKDFPTLYLEKIKYDNLMKIKEENMFDEVYYINGIKDEIWIGRIDNLTINHIEYVVAPISTMNKDLGTIRKAMIPLEKGTQMKKIRL